MRGIKIVVIVGLMITLLTVIALAQQQPTVTITVQCKDNKLTIDKKAIQLKQGHTVAYQFAANLNTCVQGLASAKITISDPTPLQAPAPQPQGWPAIVVNIPAGQSAQAGPFTVKPDAVPGGYLYKVEFFNQRDAQGSPTASLDERVMMIQLAPPFIHKVTIEISGRAESGNLFIKTDDRDPVQVPLKEGQAIKEIRDLISTALNNQQPSTAQPIDDNKILVNADKEIRIGGDIDKLNFLSFEENKSVTTRGLTFKVAVVSADITLPPPQDANGILIAAASRWVIAEARWTQDGAIVGDPIRELTGKEVTSLDVGFRSRFGTVRVDDQEIKLSPPTGANDILIAAKEEWAIKEAWWIQDSKKLGDKPIEGLVSQRLKAIHVAAVGIVKVSVRLGPASISVVSVMRWESRFTSGDRENRVINFVQVTPQLGKCGILNNVDVINKTSEYANDFEVIVEGTYAHVETIGPQPELLYYPASFKQIPQGNQTIFQWRWARGVPPGGFMHIGLWVWAPDCNIRIKSMTLTRDGRVIGKIPASGVGVTPQGQVIIINNLSEPIDTRDVQVAQMGVPLPLPTLNAQELPKQLQQQGVNLQPVQAGGVINPGQALPLPMLSITVSPASAETGTAADIRLMNIGMQSITIKSVTVTRPNGNVDTVSGFTNLTLRAGEAKTERYTNTGLVGTYTVKATFDSAEVTERFERIQPQPAPSIELSRESIDFGSVRTDQYGSATLGISNRGTGCLQVRLEIIGSDASNFSVSPSRIDCIDAGRSRDFSVTFDPRAVRSYSATLNVYHNATNRSSPISVSLTGRGVQPPPPPPGAPSIELSRESIDFGSVRTDQYGSATLG
ncbi:MAG: choice-of-anchor D domain-containing protein, partial [Candidatus Caldarchaeum sp.]